MLRFLAKLIFLLKKPPIVIVTGKGRKTAVEAISKVLESEFKVRKTEGIVRVLDALAGRILICQVRTEKVMELFSFVKNSRKPILVVTNIGEIPVEQEFFVGKEERVREIKRLARTFPLNGNLILNFEDETAREIKEETQTSVLTFGFQKGADIFATDTKENTGTNFKINYKGNIVPCWLENLFGKEQVYAALAGVGCGKVFGLNLVEASKALKKYFSILGRQRLIEGIKRTSILDDSENASVFSMMEMLKILGKLEGDRKIAVLGDILGIGKYSIEAHEAIGEEVSKVADFLFTVGPRARFIAQGAIMRGFSKENIFQFEEVKRAGKYLQQKIKKGDLILIDGSKEMKMEKIVEEIRA